MKISIGSDHGGFALKTAIIQELTKRVELIDQGTYTLESSDYPDFAKKVCSDILLGRALTGILICTSGIGISISANRHRGIRAALVNNEDAAYFSRLHNNANVICLGQKYTTPYLALKYIDIFIKTSFEGGRHQNRVDKIEII